MATEDEALGWIINAARYLNFVQGMCEILPNAAPAWDQRLAQAKSIYAEACNAYDAVVKGSPT